MTRSAILKQNQGFLSTLPVGVIIAWHRDLDPSRAYIPPLPPGWVECNGQVLYDVESPFNGQIVPNLNGDQDQNSANSPGLSRKAQMFLRGGAVSGEGQDDAFQGHRHSVTYNDLAGFFGGAGYGLTAGNNDTNRLGLIITDPTTDGKNGTPRTANETRPINMSVVWIMKVKQVVSAKATPAVQAAPNAAPGTIYINQAGNVGIGAKNPTEKLQVVGNILSSGLKIGSSPIQDGTIVAFRTGGYAISGMSPGGFYNTGAISFPKTFTSPPIVVATLTPASHLSRLYVSGLESVSTTGIGNIQISGSGSDNGNVNSVYINIIAFGQ